MCCAVLHNNVICPLIMCVYMLCCCSAAAVCRVQSAGAGLGIVVLEDVMWGRVVVQAVQENIDLRGISEEAGGEIRVGDSLYAIEKDVCCGWPMSRLVVDTELGVERISSLM